MCKPYNDIYYYINIHNYLFLNDKISLPGSIYSNIIKVDDTSLPSESISRSFILTNSTISNSRDIYIFY